MNSYRAICFPSQRTPPLFLGNRFPSEVLQFPCEDDWLLPLHQEPAFLNVFESSFAKFSNPSADDFTGISILIAKACDGTTVSEMLLDNMFLKFWINVYHFRILLCNVRLLYKSDTFITTLVYHLKTPRKFEKNPFYVEAVAVMELERL